MTNATAVINEPAECFVRFTVLPKTEAPSSSVFFQVKMHFWFSRLLRDGVTFFVLYNMCNIGAVMHWCFDRINKCHSNYFIYMPPIDHMDWIGFGSAFTSSLWIGLGHRVDGLDWIGFRKLDPCPTLGHCRA